MVEVSIRVDISEVTYVEAKSSLNSLKDDEHPGKHDNHILLVTLVVKMVYSKMSVGSQTQTLPYTIFTRINYY